MTTAIKALRVSIASATDGPLAGLTLYGFLLSVVFVHAASLAEWRVAHDLR